MSNWWNAFDEPHWMIKKKKKSVRLTSSRTIDKGRRKNIYDTHLFSLCCSLLCFSLGRCSSLPLSRSLLLASWSVAAPRWLVSRCWFSLLLLALWSRGKVCHWVKGFLSRVECLHGGEEGCLKNFCWWSLNCRQRWRWNPTFLQWVSPLCFWYLFLVLGILFLIFSLQKQCRKSHK